MAGAARLQPRDEPIFRTSAGACPSPAIKQPVRRTRRPRPSRAHPRPPPPSRKASGWPAGAHVSAQQHRGGGRGDVTTRRDAPPPAGARGRGAAPAAAGSFASGEGGAGPAKGSRGEQLREGPGSSRRLPGPRGPASAAGRRWVPGGPAAAAAGVPGSAPPAAPSPRLPCSAWPLGGRPLGKRGPVVLGPAAAMGAWLARTPPPPPGRPGLEAAGKGGGSGGRAWNPLVTAVTPGSRCCRGRGEAGCAPGEAWGRPGLGPAVSGLPSFR